MTAKDLRTSDLYEIFYEKYEWLLSNYDISLSPLGWYIQVTARQDLLADIERWEKADGDSEYWQQMMIQERIDMLAQNPKLTLLRIRNFCRINRFSLSRFSSSLLWFFAKEASTFDAVRVARNCDLGRLRDFLSRTARRVISEVFRDMEEDQLQKEANLWLLGKVGLPVGNAFYSEVDLGEEQLLFVNRTMSNEMVDAGFRRYKDQRPITGAGKSQTPKSSALIKRRQRKNCNGTRGLLAGLKTSQVLPYLDLELIQRISRIRPLKLSEFKELLGIKHLKTVRRWSNDIMDCTSRKYLELQIVAANQFKSFMSDPAFEDLKRWIESEALMYGPDPDHVRYGYDPDWIDDIEKTSDVDVCELSRRLLDELPF